MPRAVLAAARQPLIDARPYTVFCEPLRLAGKQPARRARAASGM